MSDEWLNPYGVQVGQVWQSTDKRDSGKTVTVLQMGINRAQVQGFVKSWILLKRFHPNSTGYRLLKDVK